ncbi:hypothetical protein AUTU_26210 [Aureibacter tunicatorum]|nr:hypothetical protein AUTU_26210 [Aureibacter tunicatorum]
MIDSLKLYLCWLKDVLAHSALFTLAFLLIAIDSSIVYLFNEQVYGGLIEVVVLMNIIACLVYLYFKASYMKVYLSSLGLLFTALLVYELDMVISKFISPVAPLLILITLKTALVSFVYIYRKEFLKTFDLVMERSFTKIIALGLSVLIVFSRIVELAASHVFCDGQYLFGSTSREGMEMLSYIMVWIGMIRFVNYARKPEKNNLSSN